MNDTAAFFVTDRGFLVQSLVVARQLCEYHIHKIADIFIFLVDVDGGTIDRLQTDLADEPVTLIALEDQSYRLPDTSRFKKNHVPVTTLARLVIGRYLDPTYANLVYLDGDLQILRDPSALFQRPVPEGSICAARGGAWLMEAAGLPQYENFAELDLDPESYFNAGVLAFSRQTWIEKGQEALAFFLANPEKCKVHDQTALNAAFKGRVLELSPLYNFNNVYSECGAARLVSPRIVHFTGHCKPWSGYPPPWYSRFQSTYSKVLRNLPYLRDDIRISRAYCRAHLRARRQYFARMRRERNLLREHRRRIADLVQKGCFFIR